MMWIGEGRCDWPYNVSPGSLGARSAPSTPVRAAVERRRQRSEQTDLQADNREDHCANMMHAFNDARLDSVETATIHPHKC
jgi:hypothetical protein